ncbi:hypothetical protein AZSI13_01550 [Azospira sp. I13]|uniref:energy transducer TonB n=1 Tax=Azospira sp. I13 TaxID=1765050 RepID=UPI000D44B828|nr:energy transducer TonB [Azospira sp. I13]GBG00828.1 hypothetical protein AZSI13_01550 [Azospira sp. I13]
MTVLSQSLSQVPLPLAGPAEPWPSLSRGRRQLVLLAVLALHGGLLAFALSPPPPVTTTMVPAPVTVRLIEARPAEQPRVVPPTPQPTPPKPVKHEPRPVPVASPTPRAAAPVLAAAPSAAASSDFAVAEAPRPAPVAAPVAHTPARFDADYLHNPKPVYPPLSRRLGEEGKVLLKVRVTAQGTAEQVDIQTGSGYARLDAAARDAVLRWRFVPARRGDEPVAASVIVPITFALDG